jgi:hypothetical protein
MCPKLVYSIIIPFQISILTQNKYQNTGQMVPLKPLLSGKFFLKIFSAASREATE